MYITNKIGIIIALCCATFMGVAVYTTDETALAMFLTSVSSLIAAGMAYNAPDRGQDRDRAQIAAAALRGSQDSGR